MAREKENDGIVFNGFNKRKRELQIVREEGERLTKKKTHFFFPMEIHREREIIIKAY